MVPSKGTEHRGTHALPLCRFEEAFLPPGLFLCEKVVMHFLVIHDNNKRQRPVTEKKHTVEPGGSLTLNADWGTS